MTYKQGLPFENGRRLKNRSRRAR